MRENTPLTKIRNVTTAKQKLLYIITQGQWGGAQRYVFDLATSLSSEYDITVAIGEPAGQKDLQARLAENQKITIKNLQHLARAISLRHDYQAIQELAELYQKIKPDIVHLNSTKAGVIGSWAARRLPKNNRPYIVYTAHGWVFDEPLSPLRRALYRYLEKTTASHKSAIIVLSNHDAKRGIAIGIPTKKIAVIPHGLEPARQLDSISVVRQLLNAELAQSMRTTDTDFVVGSIANLYPTKGLDNLLAAAAKIKMQTPRLKLIIIGEGPERKKLEQLIKQHFLLDRVQLPGFINTAERLLGAFNIFVLPSRKEGLPYVLLEAKTRGVPIIATDVGGISELIANKKTGLLIPPNDIDALADALLWGYQDYIEDRGQLRLLAEAGHKESLAGLTLLAMLEKTMALYRSRALLPK